MKHNYTDEEIQTAWKDALSSREFLDALPERPQAQPGPWPGQQEAIDKAFQQIDEFYLDYKSSHDDWEHEAPARLAIAQAYDAAKPQSAEIASLKAEREKWEADALRYCKNADFWRSEHDKAQAELAALRTPILADDGRSLDQVYQDTYNYHLAGNGLDGCCDAGVQAVAAVVLAQAVRRMESVMMEELSRIWRHESSRCYRDSYAVCNRLIAAVKGEAKPVVVNEPPQHEGQPDLSGESEKQDPHARLKAYAKAGARIRTHDTEWTNDVDWSWCFRPEYYEVHPDDLHLCPEYAPQAEAKAEQAEPAQAWTPAVGDTVRLKSGGPKMTVQSVGHEVCCVWACSGEIQWTKEGGAGNSISAVLATTNLPAACLIPAQP